MVVPEFLQSVPLEERERVLTERRMQRFSKRKISTSQCLECAMNPGNCICEELQKIRPACVEQVPFQVAVCMHVREKFRTSNTGKVFKLLYDSVVAIDSDESSTSALDAVIAENIDRCIVLFPSEDAQEVSEISPEILARPVILVPDGTWKQAARLVRNFPAQIPRVKINPRTLSRFVCRTQTMLERVCTAEAVALLLEDLGLAAEAERVFQGLDIVQRAYNRQTFNQDDRPTDKMKRRKPYAPASATGGQDTAPEPSN